MNWRAAESIKVLLAEVNALYPGRDKRTDGVISGYPGSVSSHQVNSAGVVCAVDLTVGDYPNGITPAQALVLAESIRHELKVAPRGIYAYVIYDRRMARSTHDWEWEPYTGTSPHTDHIHVSVDWDIPEGGKPSGQCPYDMTDSWNLTGKVDAVVQLVRPHRGPITQAAGNIQPDGNPHTGQDYGYTDGVNIFPEVFAAAAGTVLYAGDSRNLGWPNPWYFNPDFDRSDAWDSSAGNVIVIDHGGFVTTYSHLESWSVSKGDSVSPGQRIAITGNTGNSYGKHLHFELLFKPFNFGTATYGRSDPGPYLITGLAGAGSITPVQEDDMALTDKDLKDIATAVRQDLQRNPGWVVFTDANLMNIRVAVAGAILPPLKEHAQALFNAIKAVPGVDSAALQPILDAYVKKIEDITLEVTVKDLGK